MQEVCLRTEADLKPVRYAPAPPFLRLISPDASTRAMVLAQKG
jgi:hypothetical protein